MQFHLLCNTALCPPTLLLAWLPHGRGQTTPYQPSISPEPVGHLAQHHLLPLLVEAVRQQPSIDLRMGHRWVVGAAK